MKTCLFVLAVSVVGATLVGCNDNRVTYKDVTSDLTPEMKGIAERPVDDHTAFAVAQNQNLRMFWDDIGRTFYLDSPSRLSPFPIVNTSSQPR